MYSNAALFFRFDSEKAEMADELTAEDLDRLYYYMMDARRRMAMGEAIAREDFVAWARHAAAWLLDKVEQAWKWVRRTLGLA